MSTEVIPPGDYFILHIDWDRPTSATPKLPTNVGPFATRDEADQFAELNIPNGSWEVWPLAWPYHRPAGTAEAGGS